MKNLMLAICAVALISLAVTALVFSGGRSTEPSEYLHFPVVVVVPFLGALALVAAHRRRTLMEHMVRLVPWSATTVASLAGFCVLLPLAAASWGHYVRAVMLLPSGVSVGLQVYEGGLDVAYWWSPTGPRALLRWSAMSPPGWWSRCGVRRDFLGAWGDVGEGVFDVGLGSPGVAHLSFPLWLPAVLLSLAPARSFMAGRRAHRASGDLICARCSYNLRGNTSGVCPECGTSIRQPASTPRGSF